MNDGLDDFPVNSTIWQSEIEGAYNLKVIPINYHNRPLEQGDPYEDLYEILTTSISKKLMDNIMLIDIGWSHKNVVLRTASNSLPLSKLATITVTNDIHKLIDYRTKANLHIIPINDGEFIVLTHKDLIPYFTLRKKCASLFKIAYQTYVYNATLSRHISFNRVKYVDMAKTREINEASLKDYALQVKEEAKAKQEAQEKQLKVLEENKRLQQQIIEEAAPHLEILKQAKVDLTNGKKPDYSGFDHIPLRKAYGYNWLINQHIPLPVTNDIVSAMEIKVLYERIVSLLPGYKVTIRDRDAAIIVMDFNDETRAILRNHGIKYTAKYGCQNQYGRASYGRKYPVDMDLAKEILNSLKLSSQYMAYENGKVIVYLPRCYDTKVEHIIKGWTGVRGHERHLANGSVVYVRPHVRAVVEHEVKDKHDIRR